MNRGIIGTVAAVIVILIIAAGSWYTVDRTERACSCAMARSSAPRSRAPRLPIPLIDSVEKVSVRDLDLCLGQDELLLYDQQPADLKISVTLQASPRQVSDLYAKFGRLETAVNQVVSPSSITQVKEVVFGRYTAVKAIQSAAR
jgi:hypothetical protein